MKKKAKDIWIGAQIIISEQEIVNNSLYKKQIEKRLLDAKNIIDLNGLMIIKRLLSGKLLQNAVVKRQPLTARFTIRFSLRFTCRCLSATMSSG